MKTIRGAIITTDIGFKAELEGVLGENRGFTLVRPVLCHYPEPGELERYLEDNRPSVVFLDMSSTEEAAATAQSLLRLEPEIQIVGIARQRHPDQLLVAMRLGVREFLSSPLDRDEVLHALIRVHRVLEESSTSGSYNQHVFTFLPAKPGSGASTVCLNTAAALAAMPEMRVSLIELDMHCGAIDFMLQLPVGYTVRDAAQHAHQMNDTLWAQMVTSVGALDVLRAGRPAATPSFVDLHVDKLVRYARRHYSAVCLDLPGTIDQNSVMAMRQSNRILLVTTPEVASLYMTQRLLATLEDLDLKERTHIVVNRQDNRVMPLHQIEEVLARPVYYSLPNDYATVQRALATGKTVLPTSLLGKRLSSFAHFIVNSTSPGEHANEDKWNFLRGFNLFSKAPVGR